MKRVRLLGLAVLAVFALGAVVANSAFALPELLPTEAGEKFSGKSDGTELKLTTEGGTNVECSAAPAEGAVESMTLSLFHIHFSGCKSETFGVTCTGTGESSGVILVLGKVHSVYDTLSPLGVALLFLIEPTVEFSCSILAKVKVTGSVLCLVLEPTVSNVTHLFHCTQSKGVETERTWWNEAGVEQKASLKTSVNGGTAEESGEQALGTLEFTKAVLFENV